ERTNSASSVSGKSGVNITIRQHYCPRFQRRDDVAFDPIREVGGVKKREGCGGQHLLFLAPSGGLLYERRRVPFAEEHHVSFAPQPLLKEAQLCRFPRPVDALDYEELAGKPVIAVH